MDEADEVKRLPQEVRRLNTRIYFLAEENDDRRRRFAFVCQELEQTRAKSRASSIRTS